MPKFIVDLWLDGYDSEEEMAAACEEFIYDQLNFSGSSVEIKKYQDISKPIEKCPDQKDLQSRHLAVKQQIGQNLSEIWPDQKHESHKSVRSSDASTFDFICDDCGATDSVPGGWGTLRKPCKVAK